MFEQITSNIFAMAHQPEVDRPWIGYLRGREKTLLIDAGNSFMHAKLIAEQLKATGLTMPDMIALTHAHWDHSYGLWGWKQLDLEPLPISYAGIKTNELLTMMQEWSWERSAFEQRVQTNEIPLFCKPHMLLEYPGLQDIHVISADVSIEEPLCLDLGGITCRCIPVISPHTEDCVIYECPEEQVLFVGDAYCEEVIGNDWIDHPERRRQFIETVCALDFCWCVTGHHGILEREEFLSMFG